MNERATQRLGGLLQALIDLLEDGLIADARPVQREIALRVESHAAAAVVMRHDQVGLRALDGAVIRPLKVGQQFALLFLNALRRWPRARACRQRPRRPQTRPAETRPAPPGLILLRQPFRRSAPVDAACR